jgi:hypothetical protein
LLSVGQEKTPAVARYPSEGEPSSLFPKTRTSHQVFLKCNNVRRRLGSYT